MIRRAAERASASTATAGVGSSVRSVGIVILVPPRGRWWFLGPILIVDGTPSEIVNPRAVVARRQVIVSDWPQQIVAGAVINWPVTTVCRRLIDTCVGDVALALATIRLRGISRR